MEKDINELKRLFYSDGLTQYGKRKLINHYEQQIQELKEIEQIHRQENGELRERVNRLEEENEELKIIKNGIKTLETNFANDDTYYVIGKKGFLKGEYKHLLDDYIAVSLVKETIEELKEKRDDYLYKLQVYGDFRINEPNYSDLILQINFKIQVLQKLLEKRK